MRKFLRIVSNRAFATIILLNLAVDVCASVNQPSGANAETQATFGKVPLAFEENIGQIDPAVRFFSRAQGYELFLTAHEAVMVFGRHNQQARADGNRPKSGFGDSWRDHEVVAVRMHFEGTNPAPVITGLAPLDFKSNYFIDADPGRHFTDIVNHARVKYASIYPGVDLVYYGNRRSLEYDLRLAPRAKPQQIKLRFSGADKISLSQTGDLIISTGAGELTWHRPCAYQEVAGKRRVVDAKYALSEDGQIGFSIGRYDANRALVIDPILSYSSFLWGANATGIAVDSAGNSYVVGYTNTSGLPSSSGYQTQPAGYQDAYVAKIDPSGSKVIYATYLGARRGTTFGYGIAIDGSGNAYVTGKTDSGSFPVTAGAYQTTFAAGASFIAKLNANGNGLVYSTFLKGATTSSIAVDASGNAYVTGNASSIMTTAGAFQQNIRSTSSPFIAKLGASGSTMAYATYLGGSSVDAAHAIAVDSGGYAYIVGDAVSSDFPIYHGFQSNRNGTQDAFVAKMNPTGSALVFSTFLGGTESESGKGIAVDVNGQAYVTGSTESTNFPVTAGAFQPQKGYPDPAVSNAFVTKLSSGGDQLVYSSYLGGKWCLAPGVTSCAGFFTSEGIDVGTSIAVDGSGYAYVGGFATSVGFPLVDAIQDIGPGGDTWRAPFVAKVRPKGDRLVYSAVLGQRAQDERLNGLALDGNGNVYATGYNYGAAFPTAPGALLTGGTTAVIFKLSTGKYPTTIQSSLNPALSTQSVTFTASVLSVKPGGIVTFCDDSNTLGIAPMANGEASLTTNLTVGMHKITAVYSGDGNISPPIFQVINSQ